MMRKAQNFNKYVAAQIFSTNTRYLVLRLLLGFFKIKKNNSNIHQFIEDSVLVFY